MLAPYNMELNVTGQMGVVLGTPAYPSEITSVILYLNNKCQHSTMLIQIETLIKY